MNHVINETRRRIEEAQEAKLQAGLPRVTLAADHAEYLCRQAEDGERFRWLCEHALDDINGERVWQWIASNRIKLGGTKAAIDHLMELHPDT